MNLFSLFFIEMCTHEWVLPYYDIALVLKN